MGTRHNSMVTEVAPNVGTRRTGSRHRIQLPVPRIATVSGLRWRPNRKIKNRRMCLLGIAFRQIDEFPVLVLANREEFFARPTAGPQIIPRQGDAAAWLGGIDLLAGGTWLGVNEFGVLVAVTNRAKKSPPENPSSRGVLCRSLLVNRETASVVEAARRELESNQYAGCNLLIADRHNAIVIEAGDDFEIHALTPGLHLIANASF